MAAFGHEKLDVYRLALDYVKWVYELNQGNLTIDRHIRDQWIRACYSIVLNIAEGNGRGGAADRRRFFEISRGSAYECAAIQDILATFGILEASVSMNRKTDLVRIASMLSRLGNPDGVVREDAGRYGGLDFDDEDDYDYDQDF